MVAKTECAVKIIHQLVGFFAIEMIQLTRNYNIQPSKDTCKSADTVLTFI